MPEPRSGVAQARKPRGIGRDGDARGRHRGAGNVEVGCLGDEQQRVLRAARRAGASDRQRRARRSPLAGTSTSIGPPSLRIPRAVSARSLHMPGFAVGAFEVHHERAVHVEPKRVRPHADRRLGTRAERQEQERALARHRGIAGAVRSGLERMLDEQRQRVQPGLRRRRGELQRDASRGARRERAREPRGLRLAEELALHVDRAGRAVAAVGERDAHREPRARGGDGARDVERRVRTSRRGQAGESDDEREARAAGQTSRPRPRRRRRASCPACGWWRTP